MADEGVNEAVEQAVEATGHAAEVIAEEAVQIIRGHSTTVVIVGVGVGIAVGAGVGYVITKRLLDTKYQKFYAEVAEEEISQMRDHFRKRAIADDERKAKGDIEDVVESLGYKPPVEAEDQRPPEVEVEIAKEQVETRNVFEADQPTAEETGDPLVVWDFAREQESRVEGKPHVIHKTEFDEGEEAGREHVSYTYFSGDDVLTDERDAPIDNMDELVGLENLDRFGHGSEDPNIVYVRNESLGLDMEICRSEGEFAKEVAGVDPDPEDLMHSSQRRHRPRKGDGG